MGRQHGIFRSKAGIKPSSLPTWWKDLNTTPYSKIHIERQTVVEQIVDLKTFITHNKTLRRQQMRVLGNTHSKLLTSLVTIQKLLEDRI